MSKLSFALLTTWLAGIVLGAPFEKRNETQCRKTKVAILGAGTAGITSAQALVNASVDDFLIIDYNEVIGGRVREAEFGKKPEDGTPYVIELGANWVQGLLSPGGPENPIWTLAKQYNLTNTSIETFTEKGAVDYSELFDEYEDAYSTLEQDAGSILTENLQDRSVRSGLSLAGWSPAKGPEKQAVEWWEFDFEYASSPDTSSQLFSIVNYNTTFYQYSDENNFVFDERGFSAFIKGTASTYLKASDPRLLLNTIVRNISYTDDSVTLLTSSSENPCITASYAIVTASLGVLQDALNPFTPANGSLITFDPPLPAWKQTAIQSMTMATYTKIFLQFPADAVFWDTDTQFFLYADPATRGYYPVWQSLDGPGFLPGSGILFVTVVSPQSARVEAQSEDDTRQQVLVVLRAMFGAEKVPEPTAFLHTQWGDEPWARGSYSNWPPGLTLEMHQNLRAKVGRMWFAGEHTHPEYYGFLHGAWFEGQRVGAAVAGLVNGSGAEESVHYDMLQGTTAPEEYDEANGWQVSSFLNYDAEEE